MWNRKPITQGRAYTLMSKRAVLSAPKGVLAKLAAIKALKIAGGK